MEELDESFSSTSSSDEEASSSDDTLKIDIESSKKIKPPVVLSDEERLFIESIEDEIERRLEEKAAKTKLTVVNVKNIIKQVVTNEYVLALVKRAENPSTCEEPLSDFEPKLTRAKAKELSVPFPLAVWESPEDTSNTTSEVQVLLTEDLQEDDSGEEYIPGYEVAVSEDGESTTFSNPPSVEPPPAPTPPPIPTPSLVSTSETSETNWTDDGIFKIPWTNDIEESTDATIAKRTRSKLCLSSTPLEVIEEAFVPPDITPGMYDTHCDNDDWLEFIKQFARPMEEVGEEFRDEDQDPDFNILADEDIDKRDKDEFREDRAVKISRREINKLIAELFESVDLYTGDQCQTDQVEEEDEVNIEDASEESQPTLFLSESDILLLEQQMRQHVQLLTQNFILTYDHPELHHYSLQMKEYLLNLKFLAEGKSRSMFYTSNLTDALKLVEYWENLLATDTQKVRDMKEHVVKSIEQSIHAHKTHNTFILTFPDLIFETISKSSVFMYPWLLPKIPFKTPKVCLPFSKFFTDSEDQLIAIGLEQFYSNVTDDNKKKTLKQSLEEACTSIITYTMPYKRTHSLIIHIKHCRLSKSANNPIKYYFQHYKAPPVEQFVMPLSHLQVLPPCQRPPDDLPYQWKNYVLSQLNGQNITQQTPFIVSPVVVTNRHSVNANKKQTSISFSNPQDIVPIHVVQVVDSYSRPILPKGIITIDTIQAAVVPQSKKRKKPQKKSVASTNAKKRKCANNNQSDPITNFVKCLCTPLDIEKIGYLYSIRLNSEETKDQEVVVVEDEDNQIIVETNDTFKGNSLEPSADSILLPSMPNILASDKIDLDNEGETCEVDERPVLQVSEKRNVSLVFSTISSSSFQQPNTSTEVEFCSQESSTACNINQNIDINQMEIDIKPVQLTETVYNTDDYCLEDNIDDINALMLASASTTRSGAEKRRGAKKKGEFLSNLSVSTPEDRVTEKQKNDLFALSYYDKMRETLELQDYHKIIQILNNYKGGDGVELYKQVEVVLRPKYNELADEFLLFLREKEATAVDRLIPWIRTNDRSKFLRELEIYFKDYPTQLKGIYKCLAELSQTADISTDTIKSTVLAMFKGNDVLSDLFLQNFPEEPPPPSLMEGACEEMDSAKEMSRSDDEEPFESITVPHSEDKYGSQSCICDCHNTTKCGTGFINGRVYLQTGKATVSFLNNSNTDQNIRLMGNASPSLNQKRKRSDSSPSKLVSTYPSKENLDEETDEGDGKKNPQKRIKKTPDKSPEHKRIGSISKETSPLTDQSKSTESNVKDLKPCRRTNSIKKTPEKTREKGEAEQEEESISTKPDDNPDRKRLLKESLEWGDQSAAGESSCDIKPVSPDQQTADSESEFCEESSQDSCESDSDSSVSSSNNAEDSYTKLQEENSSWSREEDKVILEVFQQENDNDSAFQVIASQLSDRTVEEIKSRFETLMKLLLDTIRPGVLC